MKYKEKRGKMQNRRGIGHVEIILSFVIFIGFLIFLLVVFGPFKSAGVEEVYLDTLERGIKENTSIEVKFFSISLSHEQENCFCFDYNFDNVVVKNERDAFIEAFSKGGGNSRKICINGGGKFFYVYSSEEFVEQKFDYNEEDCSQLTEGNYVFGLFSRYYFVSNNKLRKLHKNSKEDYEKTKEGLGLPSSKDFSFNVRETEFGEENILNDTREQPKGVRVSARDIPMQIIYKDGNLKYAIMNIRVW